MYRVALVCAVLVAPGALPGQRLPPVPTYARVATVDRALAGRAVPRTYWLEGGVIGGVGVGVLGAMLFSGLGERGNRTGATIAGFAFGAAVGFPAGALIGGQFRKRER